MSKSKPWRLQESFPLQQGLKLQYLNSSPDKLRLQESFPLQQGLKHGINDTNYIHGFLQESFPLQQGLKLLKTKQNGFWKDTSGVLSTTTRIETKKTALNNNNKSPLQESFPLQQGLKLRMALLPLSLRLRFRSPFHYNKDWNWLSDFSLEVCGFLQESFPLQQGLKPRSGTRHSCKHTSFRSPFHYNKDWNACSDTSPYTLKNTSGVLSTTTRIETRKQSYFSWVQNKLQESFPLQQGLKLR